MSQQSLSADQLRSRLERYARPGVPKYVAMRDAVVSAVNDGEWPPGTRLPTESEWTTVLPVSLGTIQRALRLLVEDGVIMRRPGAGTFVAERNLGKMHAPLHCRFLDDSGMQYLPVYPEVLSRQVTRTAGPGSRHLGAEKLLCIERTLLIGNEFKVFSRFWADPNRLPALSNLPLRRLSTANFKEVIWQESHQPIGRLNQFLSTEALPEEVCTAIGIRPGTIGQLLEVAAFVGRESPIYYQELYIPPNRRRLHLASDGKDPGVL